MQIRQTSNRSLLQSMLIIASLITLTLMQNNISSELLESEQNRFASHKLADQLVRGQQERTDLARIFVVTSAPDDLKSYGERRVELKSILRPLSTGDTNASDQSGDGVDVKDIVKLANDVTVSATDFARLQEVQQLVGELEKIEDEAIALANEHKSSNALELLDGSIYFQTKAKVQSSVDGFVSAVEQRANLEVEKINAKKDKLYKNYGFLLFIILAATVFEFVWGNKKIIAPIEELTLIADRMARGEYQQRVNIESNNEIGHLATAFNGMASSIEQDISHRKQTAKEVETLRQKAEGRSVELQVALDTAEQATKSKGEFLASMSHEIRTPMNGVVGMADLLSQTSLNEDQHIMLNTIRDSGNSLLTIINDILDFSKIDAGKLDVENIPLSVSDVLEGAAATISPNASRKNVQIVTYVDPDIPDVLLGDPVRLRQIVFNLTGNAVKFSEEGEVTVRADWIHSDEDNNRVRISVVDQGIGISEEAQNNLFSAFSQADSSTTRRFGGTGLGLTICKSLVDIMGGEIFVESQLGFGSTFSVEIPMALGNTSVEKSDDMDLSGVQVLLVTESEMLGFAARRYLENSGAEVRIASSDVEVEEGIATLRKEDRFFDVIACDFNLSEERKLDITEKYKSKKTRFLFLLDGQRRSTRIHSPDIVTLDGNPLRHSQLLNAVAVAVGRASPLAISNSQDEIARSYVVLSAEEALAQGTLILLAEDNITNQNVIQRQLKMLGYTCEIADDGKLGLKAWRERDYGLLLTDCHMPHMDGFELTASIRSDEEGTGKRAPIIAVTANALEGEAQRCIAGGMDDYLSKPLKMNDLKAMLRKWMPAYTPVQVAAEEETALVSDTPQNVKVSVDEVDRNDAIDPSALKGVFGDDEETFREILKDFVEPATSNVDEIETALNGRSADGVAKAAHKLKSSARSVGANDLADLCQVLETAGKAEDWSEIDEAAPRLSGTIRKVVEYIDYL